MNSSHYIVALDQGTTSSKAVVYNSQGEEITKSSVPLACHYPHSGWVEQDPLQIWQSQRDALVQATKGIDPKQICAIGITNQRETTIAWSRKTGKPLAPAIVWQCRRTAEICERLKRVGLEKTVKEKTGLVLDPYFSGSKILWMIENHPQVASAVADGSAVFGTVDAWILYNLTNSKTLATEPSNASRTLLYNLDTGSWDDELMRVFGISEANLPQIRDSWGDFGYTDLLGVQTPISGILGDQQASLFGHGCYDSASVKCTFGTGAFLLMNVGQQRVSSSTGLLSTVAWRSNEKKTTYALEGSVFIAGALVQWLRDNMHFINSSEQSETKAAEVADSGGVIVVPAFVGLGAPHWDAQARGAIFGITRETNDAHLVRASLEAVAHQVADLIEAAEFDNVSALAIDGGMSTNLLFCQLLADFSQRTIQAARSSEMTALGAARAAYLGAQMATFAEMSASFASVDGLHGAQFQPAAGMQTESVARKRWKEAVRRAGGAFPD